MPGNEEQVWDAGLQPERTSLAWHRSAVAMLGLGLALPALAWPVLGRWTLLLIAVPSGALVLLVASSARYRHLHRALTGRGPLHDGRLPLLASAMTLVLALLAVAVTVMTVARR